jgi:hypothetical protein
MKVAMEGPRIRRVGGRRLERGLARLDDLDQPEVEAQECRLPARRTWSRRDPRGAEGSVAWLRFGYGRMTDEFRSVGLSNTGRKGGASLPSPRAACGSANEARISSPANPTTTSWREADARQYRIRPVPVFHQRLLQGRCSRRVPMSKVRRQSAQVSCGPLPSAAGRQA